MSGPFTDHHVHFLSTVAARLSVDVSGARSIEDLGRIVRAGAGGTTGWVRAWGYEEWLLGEERHPTRVELDRVMANRPLVVHHRSGHVAVANSAALAEMGEPDHPDGILFDRHNLLSRAPRLDASGLEAAAAAVSAEWEAAGVAAFVDATHTNGVEEVELLASWCDRGVVRQEVTAMVAAARLDSVPGHGQSVGRVVVGSAKLMPVAAGLARLPDQVRAAHACGFPVAVHVVEIDVLDATLGAFESSPPPPGTVDRIEHNSLCLPEQVGRIAASGAMVVVNPGFLVHRRAKYTRQLDPVELPWLIRIGSLLRAGIPVRAGSDSPVTPSGPGGVIAGAVAHPFAPGESVSREEAERLLHP